MDALLPAMLLVAVAAAIAGWLRSQRRAQRAQIVSTLLDAADALEARLRAARSEIEAIAGDQRNPVRAAMQDILRQRLWLQEHALVADLNQLQAVRDALELSRTNLEQQLQLIAKARGSG